MKSKIVFGMMFLLASCLDDSVISVEEQLRRDVVKIDQYLVDHGITDVIRDASGLRIQIHTLGEDLPPNLDNDVVIDYEGHLLDGTPFTDGVLTYRDPIGTTIYGWQEAFRMIPTGSEATVYIPSVYGYGAQGKEGIPGNASLIFDVFLKETELTTQQEAKMASDGTIINNFLVSEGIDDNVTTHSSGLKYEILSPGTGPSPTLYDKIQFKFVGKFIPSKEEFGNREIAPNEVFSSRLCNFMNAFKIAMPLIKEGGKIRLYVPSTLGNGTRAVGNVPANSNLFFEVELMDVVEEP